MALLAENSFNYVDSGGVIQRLCPARITNHLISPAKWGTHFTIDYLIVQNWEKERCVCCNNVGKSKRRNVPQCLHGPCVQNFRDQARAVEENLVEIREAGPLGKGAFAKADIAEYQLLGEYLGELVPENWMVDATDSYIFIVEGEFVITAKDFGNWTRFVNHNCNPNVSVIVGMYGRRRSVVFRANRDIPAGEQLGIHYGENYFNQLQITCNCGVQGGPHMPVGSGPEFPWPPEPMDDSEGSEYLP